MQSKYATPFVDATHPTIAMNATRAPLTAQVAMRDGSDAVERWRTWCARGAKIDRETARTMNRVFVAIVLALSAWFVFQLLS